MIINLNRYRVSLGHWKVIDGDYVHPTTILLMYATIDMLCRKSLDSRINGNYVTDELLK